MLSELRRRTGNQYCTIDPMAEGISEEIKAECESLAQLGVAGKVGDPARPIYVLYKGALERLWPRSHLFQHLLELIKPSPSAKAVHQEMLLSQTVVLFERRYPFLKFKTIVPSAAQTTEATWEPTQMDIDREEQERWLAQVRPLLGTTPSASSVLPYDETSRTIHR
jgi:hypothetical protein